MRMKMMKKLLMAALAACMLTGWTVSFAETDETQPATVDLDLSVLSGTVVYAQVYNLCYEPEAYLGKIIRMAGYYSAYEDTEKDVVYHACVIPDATACCAQGIEFVLAGEHSWPEDYPEEATDIIVTGRLETYEEDGYMFLHLVDATVEVAAES